MTTPAMHRGGAGTPMVLLHGFTDTWRAWTPVLASLEACHDVLAPTLPGHHGAAPFDDGAPKTITTTADVLERQMDDAGFPTAHLVGNSFGGWLSLELAARGRARSVVALCPAGGWEHGSREGRAVLRFFWRNDMLLRLAGPRWQIAARRPRLRALAMRDLVAHPSRVPAQAAADMFAGAAAVSEVRELLAGARHVSPFGQLGAIDCPVRIAYATRDRILRWPGHYVRFQRLVPQAEFLALHGLGHIPMWDDPDRVAQVILEFTERAESQ